jgi:hypothetical protein
LESLPILRTIGRRRNFPRKRPLRTCRQSLWVSWETPPATPLDAAQPFGALAKLSYLPPVTKTKPVCKRGDAPSNKVARFRWRNGIRPGYQATLRVLSEDGAVPSDSLQS